ncbi:MAG: hypothetical protein JW873_02190 [Candidatus Saganbacteria bacterium]|nr:hypothetical protein [Candidatus Saganbacteria bacterium]
MGNMNVSGDQRTYLAATFGFLAGCNSNKKYIENCVQHPVPDEVLSELFSAGFSPAQICDVLKIAAEATKAWRASLTLDRSSAVLESSYAKLRGAVRELGALGWNARRIYGLLTLVDQAVGHSIDAAYSALPGLVKAGFTNERICSILKSVQRAAKYNIRDPYQVLPELVREGFTDEEICALIKSVEENRRRGCRLVNRFTESWRCDVDLSPEIVDQAVRQLPETVKNLRKFAKFTSGQIVGLLSYVLVSKYRELPLEVIMLQQQGLSVDQIIDRVKDYRDY